MNETLISNTGTVLKCQKKVINKDFVINRGIMRNGDKKTLRIVINKNNP